MLENYCTWYFNWTTTMLFTWKGEVNLSKIRKAYRVQPINTILPFPTCVKKKENSLIFLLLCTLGLHREQFVKAKNLIKWPAFVIENASFALKNKVKKCVPWMISLQTHKNTFSSNFRENLNNCFLKQMDETIKWKKIEVMYLSWSAEVKNWKTKLSFSLKSHIKACSKNEMYRSIFCFHCILTRYLKVKFLPYHHFVEPNFLVSTYYI